MPGRDILQKERRPGDTGTRGDAPYNHCLPLHGRVTVHGKDPRHRQGGTLFRKGTPGTPDLRKGGLLVLSHPAGKAHKDGCGPGERLPTRGLSVRLPPRPGYRAHRTRPLPPGGKVRGRLAQESSDEPQAKDT